MIFPLSLLSLVPLLSLAPQALAEAPTQLSPPIPYKHDSSFVPNIILRVTTGNLNSSTCKTRSAAVVNGTSPGPELRIHSNETTWIRVYNDMPNENLTMVCLSPLFTHQYNFMQKSLRGPFGAHCVELQFLPSAMTLRGPSGGHCVELQFIRN
jgi:FtsP/CotA-like multicopper oxidase with cupredoxin domain